jgi:cyclic lactone autoinducer peptide
VKKALCALVSGILTLLALANVASACMFTNYQPDLPAKLK